MAVTTLAATVAQLSGRWFVLSRGQGRFLSGVADITECFRDGLSNWGCDLAPTTGCRLHWRGGYTKKLEGDFGDGAIAVLKYACLSVGPKDQSNHDLMSFMSVSDFAADGYAATARTNRGKTMVRITVVGHTEEGVGFHLYAKPMVEFGGSEMVPTEFKEPTAKMLALMKAPIGLLRQDPIPGEVSIGGRRHRKVLYVGLNDYPFAMELPVARTDGKGQIKGALLSLGALDPSLAGMGDSSSGVDENALRILTLNRGKDTLCGRFDQTPKSDRLRVWASGDGIAQTQDGAACDLIQIDTTDGSVKFEVYRGPGSAAKAPQKPSKPAQKTATEVALENIEANAVKAEAACAAAKTAAGKSRKAAVTNALKKAQAAADSARALVAPAIEAAAKKTQFLKERPALRESCVSAKKAADAAANTDGEAAANDALSAAQAALNVVEDGARDNAAVILDAQTKTREAAAEAEAALAEISAAITPPPEDTETTPPVESESPASA